MPFPVPNVSAGKGQQRIRIKEKVNARKGIGEQSREGQALSSSAARTTSSNDPTLETISICVAGSCIADISRQEWLTCTVKFDSGADDDWISQKLVTKLGLSSRKGETWECKSFNGSTFYVDKYVPRLTWTRETSRKSISGPFQVAPTAVYDLLVGSTTMKHESIDIIYKQPCKHEIATLVVKKKWKLTKEEVEANAASLAKQKAETEALLKAQKMPKPQVPPTSSLRR